MKFFFSLFLFSITISFNCQIVTEIDSNTNESVNFEKISKLPNNAVIDGVIYKIKDKTIYKRVFFNSINVKWFGAKGDGISDDTKAIQDAVNVGNSEVFFPVGVYLISKKIKMQNNVRLKGVGAGAYFSGEGYHRLSVIKPKSGFSSNAVVEVDPLNISPGLAYMYGISVNDLLFDMINIKNDEKICLNLLSLSNSETFSNIRIINNNRNIAINIDRSSSFASYEPDGLIFQNIYTLQAESNNFSVNLPVLKIGNANEISFYDCKFQRGADINKSVNSKAVYIKSTMSDRATNAVSFYSCSFAGAHFGVSAESRDLDGQGVRNLRIYNGTFENLKYGITLKGTSKRPNQFALIMGNRFLSTAIGGSNIVLDEFSSNNQILADELTTIIGNKNSSANMFIGGNVVFDFGVNNVWFRRNGNAFEFNHYKTDWVSPPLLSGWVSNTANKPKFSYSKQGTKIILRGYLTNGRYGYPNYIVQLPIGFRPKDILEFSINTDSGHGVLIIRPDGNIFVNNATSSGGVSLTGIEFYID